MYNKIYKVYEFNAFSNNLLTEYIIYTLKKSYSVFVLIKNKMMNTNINSMIIEI